MTYPMEFPAQAESSFGINEDWTSSASAGAQTITCAIPKEFGGPGTGSSPEDLYIQALLNCYIATFKVIAVNSKIQFESIAASGLLVLDKGDGGAAWMQSAHLKFHVSGSANPERTQRLMERVSKQCMVINSVKTEVTFELTAE